MEPIAPGRPDPPCDRIAPGFDGPTQLNRFLYPGITDDGREKIRFKRTGNTVLTELPSEPGRGARIQVLEPEGLELELQDLRLEHPNGFMGILQAETDAPRIRVRGQEQADIRESKGALGIAGRFKGVFSRVWGDENHSHGGQHRL